MRKFYILLMVLVVGPNIFAQRLVHNNGASVFVKSGCLVSIKMDSLVNSGAAGLIDNRGEVRVYGNIVNDATINGNNDSIKLTGDWINNNTYTGNNSWVDFFGNNELITGNVVTTFNNLRTRGASTVKRQTLNAVTRAQLQLVDAELATDNYQMLVTNTDPAAISWTTGFVSSIDTGNLARTTNSTNVYVFPTGSPSYNNPPSLFRPATVAPASSANNTYAAALVKGDATNDGYDRSLLDTSLCAVNPHFYHRLYHNNGSDAVALAMFYDASADGNWSLNAHWKNNLWNNLGAATAGSAYGLSSVTTQAVSDFNPYPFALAEPKFSVSTTPIVTISAGESVVLSPTVTSPNTTNFVWTPDTALSCANCPNPTANPVITTHYTVTITDANGCVVIDTVEVIVNSAFQMPDAFTPNGDGRDDIFGPVTKSQVNIKAFRIYNRWGQLIHNSTAYWDGKFKGEEQPVGTFLYYIEVESVDPNNPTATITKTKEGSVVLLR